MQKKNDHVRQKVKILEVRGYADIENWPSFATKKLFEMANDAGLKGIPLSELSIEPESGSLHVYCYRYMPKEALAGAAK